MNQTPFTADQLREKLRIDPNDLDGALVEQPELYFHAGHQHTVMISCVDAAKEDLKALDAEIAMAIRADETIKKRTESSILEEVQCHSVRRQSYAALLTLQREAGEWQALRDAFAQRAYVLKDLAGLFVAGYFAANATKSPAAADTQYRANVAALTQARQSQKPRPVIQS